jgi:hypothetical protein
MNVRNVHALNIMSNWLQGTEYKKSTLDLAFTKIKKMELDCEHRSVELIREWDLPINIDNYIKSANRYIYFYNFVRKYRTWDNIYNKSYREVSHLMPIDLIDEYTKTPSNVMSIFTEKLSV